MPLSMDARRADRIVQRLWDKDVEAWERHWVPIFRRFAVNLVREAKLSPGQLVLDIGTGTGVAAFEAAEEHAFVFGIDRSDAMLAEAKRKALTLNAKTVRFLAMDGANLRFPDYLFDAIISNCGFSFISFGRVAREAFRVLRHGGVFMYNEWSLRDVTPHRVFGDILETYRTSKPSAELRNQRVALATFQRYHHRRIGLNHQRAVLRQAGFHNLHVSRHVYGIHLGGVYDYLEARFSRSTLRRELKELPRRTRKQLYDHLAEALKPFSGKSGFRFKWQVTFLKAQKP